MNKIIERIRGLIGSLKVSPVAKALYESLSLYDWLLRCPDGSIQLGKYAWVEVRREGGGAINASFTTHEEYSDRYYDNAFFINVDAEGVVDMYYQIREMHRGYDREMISYSKDKHIAHANELEDKLVKLFRKNGHRFYNNPIVRGENNE